MKYGTLAWEADTYALGDIPVFPLAPGTKNPLKGTKGFKDATTDQDQIQAWWEEYPEANIGSPIPAGYVVFDVDDPNNLQLLGDTAVTAVARSGGKNQGYHVWFKLPDGVTLKAKANYPELPGIDVLSEKHYMVLPPSKVDAQYEWVRTPGSGYRYVQPCPAHLLEILGASREPERKWVDEAIERAEAGSRNDTGFWLACQLRDAGIVEEDAEWWILQYQEAVEAKGDHPYTIHEAQASLHQAYSQEAREPALCPVSAGVVSQSLSHSTQSITHSLTQFPHSPKTELDWAEQDQEEDELQTNVRKLRPDLMRRMRDADALSDDGVVQHSGTNANKRRRAQRVVLQDAWGTFWPPDKHGNPQELSLNDMATILNWYEHGDEGEVALDELFVWRLARRKRPITFPRGNLLRSLYLNLHPEERKGRHAA